LSEDDLMTYPRINLKTISVNLGPNSQRVLRQSYDNIRTYDNLMTVGEFTEHLRQSYDN